MDFPTAYAVGFTLPLRGCCFGFDERGVSEFAKLPVPMITRRKFLTRSAFAAGCALSLPRFLQGASGPSLQFPSQPRERIAIASYPFRDFVVGIDDKTPGSKMELKDFAALVGSKFNIRKIERWSVYFT